MRLSALSQFLFLFDWKIRFCLDLFRRKWYWKIKTTSGIPCEIKWWESKHSSSPFICCCFIEKLIFKEKKIEDLQNQLAKYNRTLSSPKIEIKAKELNGDLSDTNSIPSMSGEKDSATQNEFNTSSNPLNKLKFDVVHRVSQSFCFSSFEINEFFKASSAEPMLFRQLSQVKISFNFKINRFRSLFFLYFLRDQLVDQREHWIFIVDILFLNKKNQNVQRFEFRWSKWLYIRWSWSTLFDLQKQIFECEQSEESVWQINSNEFRTNSWG